MITIPVYVGVFDIKMNIVQLEKYNNFRIRCREAIKFFSLSRGLSRINIEATMIDIV